MEYSKFLNTISNGLVIKGGVYVNDIKWVGNGRMISYDGDTALLYKGNTWKIA